MVLACEPGLVQVGLVKGAVRREQGRSRAQGTQKAHLRPKVHNVGPPISAKMSPGWIALDQRERVEEARRLDVCPQCGVQLTEKNRVGSGSFADGVFCSLECLTTFHAGYFEKRKDEGGFSTN